MAAGGASPSTRGFYGFTLDPSTVTYYPVGDSPPVDLTEGRRLPPHPPRLLLLGCGDIRSVLHTTHVLYTSCPPAQLPTALHFHLNDIEAGVLARDLLLLRLASGQDACLPASEDAQFLWSAWYEALLGSRHAARLKDVLEDLCQEVSQRRGGDMAEDVIEDGNPVQYSFGNESTRVAVKEALEEYNRLSVCTVDVLKGRNERIAFLHRSLDPVGQATERIASVFQEQQGCMKDPQLRMRCRKEIEDFVRTGMTSVPWSTRDEAELRRNYTGNPTYFRPGSTTWCVPESACVFLSRDIDLDDSGHYGGLSSLLFMQMAEHVASFQKLQRQRGVKVTFTLWHGEALALSESVLPSSLKFDFINTSNLADNVGLLNLLVMYGSSRLRPGSGLLSLQSFRWKDGLDPNFHFEDSLTRYMGVCLQVSPEWFGTLFGLTWDGEDKNNRCKPNRLGSFVGAESIRFFFKANPEPNEKIEPTEVAEGLRYVLSFCATIAGPTLGSRPVVSGIRTYMHLAWNLSRSVEGGMDQIRKLTFENFVEMDIDFFIHATQPSLGALDWLLHGHVWGPTHAGVVEVSLPVEVASPEIAGKEELHFCGILLTTEEDSVATQSYLEILRNQGFPRPCFPVIKDFTFHHRQRRVTFVLPKEMWNILPEDTRAVFESCVRGKPCVLRSVQNVKSAATFRDLQPDEARAAARRGKEAPQLVEHKGHTKIKTDFNEVSMDMRPLDTNLLLPYVFNKHSELTLYLNFWREVPFDSARPPEKCSIFEQTIRPAVRNLRLEIMRTAIHEGTPRLVLVKNKEKEDLCLKLHGFKIVHDAPALLVTVLWAHKAKSLIEAEKLRLEIFQSKWGEMLGSSHPRHSLAASPEVQEDMAKKLVSDSRHLQQDYSRDKSWIFQSFIRPRSSNWNEDWKTFLDKTNEQAALEGSPVHKVGDCTQECSQEDYASMCLECCLASGKEFHRLQKTPTSAAANGAITRFCSHCRARQRDDDVLQECQSCHSVAYCCEECQGLDSDRHKESCPSPSF